MSASPDHAYRLAVLVLLALGSLSVASQVSRRWWPGSQRAFLGTYAGLLTVVVAWAVPLVAPGAVVGDGPARWVLGVLLGLPLGVAASRADRELLRRLRPGAGGRPRRPASGGRAVPGDYEVRPTGWTPSGGSVATRARPAPGSVLPALPADRVAVGLVLLVGALEEVVLRGDLVRLSLRLDPALAALALAATVVFFGLMHASYDWRHAVAKAPLGALALLGVLGSGTVLCAVVAHLVFNLGVLAESRRAAAPTGPDRDRRPAPPVPAVPPHGAGR